MLSSTSRKGTPIGEGLDIANLRIGTWCYKGDQSARASDDPQLLLLDSSLMKQCCAI
jgi:hypothetical protein